VNNPANGVIQDLGGGERLMPTFVSQDPQTCSKKTLDEAVKSPEGIANGFAGNSFGSNIVMEDIEGNGEAKHVSEDIAKPLQTGSLEAVGWDGISNVLDGEIWQLESVAIAIN
jgi:hypothetical protein